MLIIENKHLAYVYYLYLLYPVRRDRICVTDENAFPSVGCAKWSGLPANRVEYNITFTRVIIVIDLLRS